MTPFQIQKEKLTQRNQKNRDRKTTERANHTVILDDNAYHYLAPFSFYTSQAQKYNFHNSPPPTHSTTFSLMAHLTPPHPPLSSTANSHFTLESDDISSLLHNLLHNTSRPSTSNHPQPPPLPEDHGQFPGSTVFSESPALLDPGFPFSGGYYSSGLPMEGIDDADCQSEVV